MRNQSPDKNKELDPDRENGGFEQTQAYHRSKDWLSLSGKGKGSKPMLNNGLKAIHTKVGKMTTSKKMARHGTEDFLSGDNLDSPKLSGTDLNNQMVFTQSKKNGRNGMNGTGKQSNGPKSQKKTFTETKTKNQAAQNGSYIKPWSIISQEKNYSGSVDLSEFPQTPLDQLDYSKRLRFEQLKKTRLEAMCQWKQKDTKGLKKGAYIKEIQKKNSQILKITEKNNLEKLDVYTDRFPMLILRKSILRVIILIQMTCFWIIQSKAFDNVSIVVILANSFTMIIDDSGTNDNPDPIWAFMENLYLGLYTVEMVFKILGMGFLFNKNAYLKDSWNILDFFIVMTSYSGVINQQDEVNTNDQPGEEKSNAKFSTAGLRVFRVLRPLKTISSVKGLKVLIQALFSALPLLGETLMILMFFFIIFAIAGVQMFNGLLKNRCIAIQTGMVHPDDLFCPGQECPGGYFCGKGSANPNYGVTNFDNLFYCVLAVFQCVTLEGWSDIQKQMQQAMTYYIFLFFIPLVLIGAFFLLNLLLAVINSKFTEEHKKQQQKDLDEIQQAHGKHNVGDSELEMAIKTKDEMSITQYITARIYAKKMIEFLRMRQEIKRIENERLVKVKALQKADKLSKRIVVGSKPLTSGFIASQKSNGSPPGSIDGRANSLQMQKSSSSNKNAQSSNLQNGETFGDNHIIHEEEGEQVDDPSDQEQLDREIQEFLLISKVQMQRAGQQTIGLNIPKKVDTSKTNGNGQNGFKTISTQNQVEGFSGPTMKGNIGPTNKNQFAGPVMGNTQKELFQKMAEEFDIDNVIPKIDQKDKASEINDASSMKSFELSAQNYDLMSQNSFKNDQREHSAQTATGKQNMIPGLNNDQSVNENESGLITSDSDFEMAAAIAAGAQEPQDQDTTTGQNSTRRNGMNLKKDVTKTFKKMLTSNHNRINTFDAGKTTKSGVDQTDGSTKYEMSNDQKETDQQTQSHLDIESKYRRKKTNKKNMISKVYKEDNVDVNYLEDKFENNQIANAKKTNKNDIRQLEEFVSTKRPKDQFRDLDPLTQKVEIAQDKAYSGTSQLDVFYTRTKVEEDSQQLLQNQFLQLPEASRDQDDPDFAGNDFVRSQFEPYQQKITYKWKEDSSEIDAESDEEDAMQAQEQPYQTATSIAYDKILKQIFLKEKAKRSDIIISSTLSVSLFPKDQRQIEQCFRVEMDQDELTSFVDEKNAFSAMLKEHQYQSKKVRVKDKHFRDNYSKSFFQRAFFKTDTLKSFKLGVQQLNMNTKVVVSKTKETLKMEKLKHDQNKRASEKRGLPKFDLETAKKLLDGKFHEEDEEEIELTNKMQSNVYLLSKDQQNLKHQNKLEDFENQVRIIFADDENSRLKPDEIPDDIRKEFDLPKQMDDYEVNFNHIRKHDASKKRYTPSWSGQDVIPDKIDSNKSSQICDQINTHRVWPLGVLGMIKRTRFVIRLHVKSDFYDNLFTFLVLLNTITLSLNQYPLTSEMEDFLELSNTLFTWFFIYEMVLKIMGIGINKYIGDRMNWLDGGIVLISIFELMKDILMPGGTQNLSGLKTIRMLRTFRVFRVVRLLRTLKSMQTIIGVMQKSYSSFIYITILMFLFIFIFTLLGMQTFGGIYQDDPEGVPSNNFDSFSIGFVTMFQVLTMENWQTVLFVTMRNNNINKFVTCGIYIAWIFIGNFILLNLFLAILLDSFLEENDDELDEQQLAEIKKLKRQRAFEKKKRKNANEVYMSTNQIKKNIKLPELSKFYFGVEKAQSEEDLEDLDEEQIVQIFKDQGMIKKDKSELKQQKLFAEVNCEQAFYLFGKDSWFRIACYRLIKHKYWETVVLVLICFSSLKLAFDTWERKTDSLLDIYAGYADLFFNYAFICEMSIKLVALGFCMDDGSYLRDEWNQMDFFIVVSSIFDMALVNVQIDAIKILRMLRALRPLRFITHNVAMKLIVKALIESLGGIFNVLIVIGVVFLIFAIMGVNFFAGKFFSCSIDPFILHTEIECEFAGGKWSVFDHHFDNVTRGFITLYIVSSLEGWPDIMLQAINVVGVEKGPKQENQIWYIFFFIGFILLGSFFFLNFFIGVLFMKFNAAQREEQKGFTTKDLSWMDIQRLILSSNPDYETTNVPKQEWRKQFHNLVSSQKFDIIIMVAILLNMVQMAVLHESQTQRFSNVLEFANYIFTAIFIVEAALKLVAFGTSYFNNSWNKFDFCVVFSSILDLLMSFVGEGTNGFLARGPQLARVLRVLRVTRILRLAGKAEGLQAILQTITFSIPALANVFLLLVLIYFMFSVLGNFLFAKVVAGDVIDDKIKNFGNFINAFLLLFALSTGEDWNKVMFDCARDKKWGCIENINCGQPIFAYIYFMMLILVCSHVMLNLFILVIIQQFEKYYLPDDNMLAKFKNDQISFMRIWKQLTQDRYQCLKIKENQLTKFFRLLGDENEELGFSEEKYDDGELKKQLLKMAIKSDNGYIYFNEMLYRCMRRRYGNMKINKQMQIYELRTQYYIYLMTLAIQNKGSAHLNNESIFNNIIKKENGVNPFLTVMNFKISFKTWLKHSKGVARLERAREKGEEINPEDEEAFITKKARTVIVDIEVEYNNEFTSEEEQEDSYDNTVVYGKSFNGFSQDAGSQNGSFRDIGKSKKKKRDKDYLASFNKKMTGKLKERMLQEGNKSMMTPAALKKTQSTEELKPMNKKNQTFNIKLQ